MKLNYEHLGLAKTSLPRWAKQHNLVKQLRVHTTIIILPSTLLDCVPSTQVHDPKVRHPHHFGLSRKIKNTYDFVSARNLSFKNVILSMSVRKLGLLTLWGSLPSKLVTRTTSQQTCWQNRQNRMYYCNYCSCNRQKIKLCLVCYSVVMFAKVCQNVGLKVFPIKSRLQ